MSAVVADASAILAVLLDEPGADTVVRRIHGGAVICAVNWAEVVTRLVDVGADASTVRADIAQSAGWGVLQVIAFDQHLAEVAAELRLATRDRGLSLGDRACLALARHLGLPAVTADRDWADIDVGVPVVLIR